MHFLTVATEEYFQEEVMGRKETRITFLRKFLPILRRERSMVMTRNFPRKGFHFWIETRTMHVSFFPIRFFLRAMLSKIETFLIDIERNSFYAKVEEILK